MRTLPVFSSHRHPVATLRRLLATVLALLATATLLSTTPPAHAARVPAVCDSRAPTVDGFQLTHLPPGLGDRTSEFAYTWEDVDFRNLVWESHTDDPPAYRVDLNAHVLRGTLLTSTDTLRQYLSTYLERDPSSWHLTPVQLPTAQALLGDEDIFWLVRPGVAIWISTDPARFTRTDLTTTAHGVKELEPPHPTTE